MLNLKKVKFYVAKSIKKNFNSFVTSAFKIANPGIQKFYIKKSVIEKLDLLFYLSNFCLQILKTTTKAVNIH